MNQTKCWRCVIESKKQTCWQRFTEALEYTCFCHYRGYDDDEDPYVPYWRRMSRKGRTSKSTGRYSGSVGTTRTNTARTMGGETVAGGARAFW